MSINFDRNRTQIQYETLIGVSSTDLIPHKEDFKNYSLTADDVSSLKTTLKIDCIDYFNNGIISFSEAIDSIYQKRFSWATVKLYYSIFYMLRASMASKEIALLRCGNMFRLSLKIDASPYSTNNKKYSTTHQGTINHYKDLFKQDDKLLSNLIEDKDAYDWMQDVREIVNYRAVAFKEPDCLDVWKLFSDEIGNGTLNELLLMLQDDDEYIYCLQEEYAVVGIPIKCVKQTIDEFSSNGMIYDISKEKLKYAKELSGCTSRNLEIFDTLFKE